MTSLNIHLANVRCPEPECHGRIAFEVWSTPNGEVRARDDDAGGVLRADGGLGRGELLSELLANPGHPWCRDHEVELSPRGRRLIDELAEEGAAAKPLRVQGVVRHT
ncbi:hypothetical protein [Isoptericola sp. NPDC057653]|uniref:hypothetical protein n=1 Tax=Isoptericola sp. NPDC057653 TaxID=3346195 RepID=UPI0036CC3B61